MMQSPQNQYGSQFMAGNANQPIMQQQTQQQQTQQQPLPQQQQQQQQPPQQQQQQQTQQQTQVQHLKIDMQSMAIPPPLLQRLPQVFPKNMNSWGQIMPYFRHSKLTQKDLTTIKQVYAVHLQLVLGKQQQQRQKIQQQQNVPGGRVQIPGQINNLGGGGTVPSPQQILMMQNRAQNNGQNGSSGQNNLQNANLQNTNLQNVNNQGQNNLPNANPQAANVQRSPQQPNMPAITAQQLQVYKQQAVQAIKNLQAAGKLPATLTREQGNMYARKYLFHVLSLKQRKLNSQLNSSMANNAILQSGNASSAGTAVGAGQVAGMMGSPLGGAMNAVPAAPQRVSQFQQQRKQRAEAQARQQIAQQHRGANIGNNMNGNLNGNINANLSSSSSNNTNNGDAGGNINGNIGGINNNVTQPAQFAGQLPTNQNQSQGSNQGRSQNQNQNQHFNQAMGQKFMGGLPRSVGSNPGMRGLPNGASGAINTGNRTGPFAPTQKTADGRTILTPRLFNGIRATQDDWKKLKAIYRETASSPINLKDVTDSLTNTEKQQIVRLVRQLQQLMIITETVIIPNFYMLTKSYDGTKKLIYSELMIKQVLEKLKTGGRFYANLDLLTRIQNQITRFLGYIKEQNTKLVRMQRQQQTQVQAQAQPQAHTQAQQVDLGMATSAGGVQRVNPAVVSQQFKELAEQRQQPQQQQQQPSQQTLQSMHSSAAQQRRLQQQFSARSLQPQYLNAGITSPLSAGTPMVATPLGSSPGAALGGMALGSPAVPGGQTPGANGATPLAGGSAGGATGGATRRRRKPRARKSSGAGTGPGGKGSGTPGGVTGATGTAAGSPQAVSVEAQVLMKENVEQVMGIGAQMAAVDKERARRRQLASQDAGKYLLATLADTLNLPEQERRVEQLAAKGLKKGARSGAGVDGVAKAKKGDSTVASTGVSVSPGAAILTPSAVLATPLAFNVKTPIPARLYGTPKLGGPGSLASDAAGACGVHSRWTGKVRSTCISGAFEEVVGDIPHELERKRLAGKDLMSLVYPTPPDEDASGLSKRRKLSSSDASDAGKNAALNAIATPLKFENDSSDLGLDLDKFWDFDRVE